MRDEHALLAGLERVMQQHRLQVLEQFAKLIILGFGRRRAEPVAQEIRRDAGIAEIGEVAQLVLERLGGRAEAVEEDDQRLTITQRYFIRLLVVLASAMPMVMMMMMMLMLTQLRHGEAPAVILELERSPRTPHRRRRRRRRR